MRASLPVATLVIGVVITTASVHGSEPAKRSTPGASPGAQASAPPAKTSETGKDTAKDAKAPSATKDAKTITGTGTPAAHGATTAKLETAAAAAAAAAGAPKQGTVAVAAPTSAPNGETLEEIVARVKRRLAMESPPKRKVSAPAAASATPAPRVTLVWRPYVMWPDELTAPKTEASQPDADRDRVTLTWESDER
jgi:hypothetical protein